MNAEDTSLEALRERIDALDEELLKTLARRMEIVATVGRYKKSRGLELRDQQHFEALVKARIAHAESLHLPAKFITELYELIHKQALDVEAEA